MKAASRVPIRALERLERHIAKVIRAVLRGGLRHEVAYMFVVLESMTQPDVLPSVLYRDVRPE